jgi:hypothetical protein
MRRLLLPFLIIFGTFVISGMHFYSTQSKIQIEPGAALHVYQAYIAIIRMDSNSDISFVPEDKFVPAFEIEAKESLVGQEACAINLEDANKGCQASNTLPDNSRLKHFKSYLLPSTLSGLIFTKFDLQEFENSAPLFKPSEELRKRIIASGILFFNVLLWVKLLCFYILIFYSRNLIPGLFFIASFSIISFLSLIADRILRRGAGVYAIDPIINGSPTFNKDASVLNAIFKSLVSVSKPLLVPGPGIAIWGITPRSVALFVAFAVCASIFITGRLHMLVLVPIGLGVHFTTFFLALFFILLVCVVSGIKLSKDDIKPLFLASIPSIAICILQFSNIPSSYRISFIIFCFLLLLYVYLVFFQKIIVRQLAIRMRFNLVYISVVLYYLLSISIILFYASRYEVTDTTGFWSDGFLREASGRIAPLVSGLLVFQLLSFVVSQLWIDTRLTIHPALNLNSYSVIQNRSWAFAISVCGLFLVAIWNLLEHALA